jgi:hypothetical protein
VISRRLMLPDCGEHKPGYAVEQYSDGRLEEPPHGWAHAQTQRPVSVAA